MQPGTRALGIAVSARDRATDGTGDGDRDGGRDDGTGRREPRRATVAGAVVRADRVVDGLAFSACSVGGTDATAAVVDCFERLGREDVRHLLLAGVAPAWFNVVDLAAVRAAVDRPVIAVSFEASDGLAPHLREHFSGDALDRRLAAYESLPERVPVRPPAGGAGDAEDGRGDDAGRDDEGRDDEGNAGEGSAGDPTLWVRAVGVDDDAAVGVVRAHTPGGRRRPEPLRVAKLAARAGGAYLATGGAPPGERAGDERGGE